MRSMFRKILIAVLLVSGLCLLLYPSVQMAISDRNQTTAVFRYEEGVLHYSEERKEEEFQKAREYNEGLYTVKVEDPFDSAKEADSDSYDEILNVDMGMMGTLEIPCISVNLPVYHGTSEEVLRKGVGHLKQTPFPIGGEGSHSILSAHRGLPESRLFTDLDKLELGDYFYLYVMDETLAYQVDRIEVIEPYIGDELDIEKDKDFVTLITCTPLGVNSHRLLVRGVRVAYEKQTADELDEMYQARPDIRWYLVGIMAACILGIFIEIFRMRKRANHEKLN